MVREVFPVPEDRAMTPTCYHTAALVLAVSHHRSEAPAAKWCPDCGAAWCPDQWKGWKPTTKPKGVEGWAVISFDNRIRDGEGHFRVFTTRTKAEDSTNASLVERVVIMREKKS